MNISFKALNLPAGATQWTATFYINGVGQWDTGWMLPGATKTLVVPGGEGVLYFDAHTADGTRLTDGEERGTKTPTAGITYTYDFQTATLTESAGGGMLPGGLGLLAVALGAVLVLPRLLRWGR